MLEVLHKLQIEQLFITHIIDFVINLSLSAALSVVIVTLTHQFLLQAAAAMLVFCKLMPDSFDCLLI